MAQLLWAWLPATSLLWACFIDFLQELAPPGAHLLAVMAETQEVKSCRGSAFKTSVILLSHLSFRVSSLGKPNISGLKRNMDSLRAIAKSRDESHGWVILKQKGGVKNRK